MVPNFDLQAGIGLIAARDAAVTALLSVFGTIVFRDVVAVKAFAHMAPEHVRGLRRLLLIVAQGSVAVALLACCAWLVLQAASMADADSAREAFAAVPVVIEKTSFGHVVALQMAVLALLALMVGRRYAALCVAGVAVALQAGHSHAFSMVQGPSFLLACDVVHLLAAGAWLGGLVPLLLLVRAAPPKAGAVAARWFSPMGQWCIAALVVSAAVQGWVLVASIPGLIGTAYGWLVLVKASLFGVLLGFAWVNRYRLAPALLRTQPERAKRVLLRSLVLQSCAGVVIVVAAVVLSDLPPAMHLQALWPFGSRVSLAAVNEDADIRREVVQAGLMLAGGAALVIGALAIQRLRIAAVCAAAVIAWFAVPHLDVLLVQAYPTSFYHSPTNFTSASIVQGGAVFAQNCVTCHGSEGRGDGAAGQTLAVPPADLTAAHLWMHNDGELFWWISHGMSTPEGAPVMPGFAAVLDDDARWNVIDYIRGHNAGAAFRDPGRWPHTIKAPGFGVRCGARSLALDDLRGQFVRLSIGVVPPAAGAGDAMTVVAASDAAAGFCMTRDETVRAAYAIVSGSPQEALTGAQFLIDDHGWLRAMQKPGVAQGWDDPAMLAAEIGALRGQHVTAEDAGVKMDMPM
jgi:putative copper export protein/mono/diheme cytochrome c family protein